MESTSCYSAQRTMVQHRAHIQCWMADTMYQQGGSLFSKVQFVSLIRIWCVPFHAKRLSYNSQMIHDIWLLSDVVTALSRLQVLPILGFGSCISSNSLQKVRLLSSLWFVHYGQRHAVLTAGCTQLWMEFDLDCMPWQNWCTKLFAAVWK